MTCKYGIIQETIDGTEYDCDIGWGIACEDCPFGPFEKDTLLVYIEDGDIYYFDYSGDWATQNLIEYICEDFDDWILPSIEDDENVKEAIEKSKGTNKTSMIMLTNASVVYTESGWQKGTDWYYSLGTIDYIDFKDVIVSEVY